MITLSYFTSSLLISFVFWTHLTLLRAYSWFCVLESLLNRFGKTYGVLGIESRWLPAWKLPTILWSCSFLILFNILSKYYWSFSVIFLVLLYNSISFIFFLIILIFGDGAHPAGLKNYSLSLHIPGRAQ